MKNTIIYLLGFPGTGKYTIAQEICKQADFKLIDNQTVNHPVFSILDLNGKKLHERVWKNCRAIWLAVFDTIIHIADKNDNFVMTNQLVNEDSEDTLWFEKIKNFISEKEAHFIPVRLSISQEENEKRIVQPNRKEKLKTMNPDLPKQMAENHSVINTNHPNELTLDVTNLSARDAAKIILEHAKNCA